LSDDEVHSVLHHCHALTNGGHYYEGTPSGFLLAHSLHRRKEIYRDLR